MAGILCFLSKFPQGSPAHPRRWLQSLVTMTVDDYDTLCLLTWQAIFHFSQVILRSWHHHSLSWLLLPPTPPALGCCAFLGEALLPPGLFSKFALRVSSLVFSSTRVSVWASAATASHPLPGCDQSGSGPTPSSGAGLQPRGRSGVTPSGSTGALAHAPPRAQPQSGCGGHWSAVGAWPVRKAAELEGGAGFRPLSRPAAGAAVACSNLVLVRLPAPAGPQRGRCSVGGHCCEAAAHSVRKAGSPPPPTVLGPETDSEWLASASRPQSRRRRHIHICFLPKKQFGLNVVPVPALSQRTSLSSITWTLFSWGTCISGILGVSSGVWDHSS